MSYRWTIPAFGATPTVATAAERDAVVRANADKTAAYERELRAWQTREQQYKEALLVHGARVAAIDSAYRTAMADYERAVTAARGQAAAQGANYGSQLANYNAALVARNNQIATNKTNADRVLGSNPYPPGFAARGYCATANEVASWRNWCAPVRGLGANEPYCVWQNLAVCSVPAAPVPPTAPPPIRVPVAPVKAAYPAPPADPGPPPRKPALAVVPTVAAPPPPRPMPVPPAPRPPPPERPMPVPPTRVPPPEPIEQRGLATFGILAAVVALGAGGAYWYAKKKKKVAA